MTEVKTGSKIDLRCSFCHKSQDAVAKLISSPSDYPRAYICDECVAVCCSILDDHTNGKIRPASTTAHLPKPLEQKDTLAELLIGKYKSREEFLEFSGRIYQRLMERIDSANSAGTANSTDSTDSANSTNTANTVQEGAIQ
jgi:ATP-dependent Clp protease ATP-binding subunit ClpX